MNPTRSSYVEYGTGNMLNLDAGTIKRKIDSNEYDDEINQEVQPNGKRACSTLNQVKQFSPFGSTFSHQTLHSTSNGQAWPQPHTSNPPAFSNTATFNSSTATHADPSTQSSVFIAPSSMDIDMELTPTTARDSSSILQNPNTFHNSAASSLVNQKSHHTNNNYNNSSNTNGNTQNEYVPVHGRSMEIPSYTRAPLNEVRKYRDQRWSSCIYGTDSRIGQGMMI
ncbi:hypothetical protein BX616_006573 [Lobosporangium transversale]|uniref:Uncharacterized protein n=1 Tax=Lobosporangium transversale TaxID=64571 RepID=A0A1Y2GP47_9FUNG|nr:hypothetical protein BCR41DRAFT_397122 [Lobosporangium transversale]KAF9915249.1 hypothetical protein BX616_006573 [Lobosporangium transversale]ORZ13312.1 hypothetical protein BCR41DRAFT_397122 [Lobosporangium transversale]|eukprot:XP_021880393.1 hypothetical protein BCR41DRAFT_397122 [Lobosporangium transversale]